MATKRSPEYVLARAAGGTRGGGFYGKNRAT